MNLQVKTCKRIQSLIKGIYSQAYSVRQHPEEETAVVTVKSEAEPDFMDEYTV